MSKKSFIIGAIVLTLGFVLGYIVNGSMGNGQEVHADHEQGKGITWTCAMHPQIQLPEPGNCPICGMELIPMGEEGGTNPYAISLNEGEVKQNNVQVIEVGKSGGQNSIRLEGEIKINEHSVVIQSAHYSGRIEELKVDYEGQFIQAGDLLAKVYAPEVVKAQKELLQAAKLKNEDPSLYEAAKRKLENWKISSVQIQNIEQGAELVDYLPIYAENTGIVSKLNMELGEYIKQGQKLLELSDLSTVWVELDAYERDLIWLKEGQKVTLLVNSAKENSYQGKITYIDPVISASNRTARVRIALQNKGELMPGMFVSATVEIAKHSTEFISIPKSAVLWTGERSVVYKEIERHTFMMQEITLGEDLGAYYQVVKGVDVGDRIVKTGTFVIDAAAQLKGRPSMMNKIKLNNNDANIQNDSVLSWYLLAKKALQNNQEQYVKTVLSKIMKALPALKIKHPHLLHFSGDKFKQAFSDFSLSFSEEHRFSQKVYLIKCPMANSEKGGYWLSDEPMVDNPYFGGEMKGCGAVQK